MTSDSAVDDIDHGSETVLPSEENEGTPDITQASFLVQHETADVKSLPQGEDTGKQQFMFVPEKRDETQPVIRDDFDDTCVKSGVSHESSSVGSLNPEIPKPVLTTELVSDPTKPNQISLTQLDSSMSVVHDETTEMSENRLKDLEQCVDVATDEQHAVTSEISHSDIKSQHRSSSDSWKPEDHGLGPIEKDDEISGVSEKDNEAHMDVIPYVESVDMHIATSESLQTSLLDVTDSSLNVSDDSSQSDTTVSLKTEGTVEKYSMVGPQSETEDKHANTVSLFLAGAVHTDAKEECPPDDVIVTALESVESMPTDVSAECVTQIPTTLKSEPKVRFKIMHTEEQGADDSGGRFHMQV